ncbi:glycosyltransferase [Mucilaginibacter sp. SG564]|uniref:glycosyltransferase n=1 Tax=Mucilaginibacter sp. SG564 TaxID=2587022 RepID=UPI001552A72B|nr:glycosyltransferase [Mucilaginibacter sp. SG564]NOW97580.1 MGT family glycosyltransferase [Mucilaginibacter sp. SG564]
MEMQAQEQLKGKKILFATIPADGHFNPLTGLAKHLQSLGCDVRWFTSDYFAGKLEKLGIPHYGYKKTLNLTGDNVDDYLNRRSITDPIEKLNFDFEHIFIARSPESYADIAEIHESFPFDLLIADSTFTAIPLVRAGLNKPVLSIGIVPLVEDTPELAPFGMALPPATDEVTQAEYAMLHEQAVNILFKKTIDLHEGILNEFGVKYERSMFPNLLVKQADLYLQIGSPGFDYERSQTGSNVRYVGALLPYQPDNSEHNCWFDERLNQYEKIILVTQGTVEKDTSKLTEPTLEAFKDTDVLVIATTVGSNTEALREKYNFNNIIIEDYIPFSDVMPYASVYITNGGYGGSLLSVNHQLPMVAAGLHEGKSEICARIGYLEYGINLNTEIPTPAAIKAAAEEVMANEKYKHNMIRLYHEMNSYNARELCTQYIAELLSGLPVSKQEQIDIEIN